MTKILCAIDDTDHSLPAIAHAAKLASALNAELALVAVNQLIGGYSRGGSPVLLWTDSDAQRVLANAVAEVQKIGKIKTRGVTIESRDPAQAIIYFAEQEGFDHIVLGTGGKGAVQRLVLGSVSRDVVYRAHCPVTVVR
ncbi:universal stress protein [Hyphomicrobium sp. CS1GBMeth3]|uniref:universal stress protein n=1 Tax=Hyphomicrobium sp. CS1GBMeth3 TaxID=1892845 RepID=UPI0009320517|nr:universal stress protein [Hyphomicrobium sp. CS1GBMeth3]